MISPIGVQNVKHQPMRQLTCIETDVTVERTIQRFSFKRQKTIYSQWVAVEVAT